MAEMSYNYENYRVKTKRLAYVKYQRLKNNNYNSDTPLNFTQNS
jgi:hypothetical protein